MTVQDRTRGCLLGLAVGDAVGTTVEFSARGSFTPVTDMVGGGPFGLQPGQWTDDTSMALCLATSLVECGGFDPRDQMQRYLRWRDRGELSSNGRCFDIGGTVAAALRRFEQDNHPYAGSPNPKTAGNGSIMRLAPVPIFYYPDHGLAIEYAGLSSSTTHAALECLDACRLLASILCRAFDGQSKSELLRGHDNLDLCPAIADIAAGTWHEKSEDQIAGSGYVVKSLEAAVWCFEQTTSYRDAVLKATNLGDDADTTAAIVGQIAGAYYGESGLPTDWLSRLTMRAAIADLADRLTCRQTV